jgi:hypothetical protein
MPFKCRGEHTADTRDPAPSVCIVAHGAKSVMVGDDLYEYESAQVAVYSVDIPVAAQINRTNHAEPDLT